MDALHPYQRLAIKHILDTPRCALWVEMGLGKSVVTLKAVESLLDSVDVRKVLIVAPLRVCLTTWPAEIAKWGIRASYKIIHGTPTQRKAAVSAQAEIFITNYESLSWMVETYGRDWPFDMVVLDESVKVKSRSSQRWKALAKVQGQISRLVELTVTPAPNGLMDIWAQICLLDRGQRLGRSLTRFRERWFDSDYMGFKFTPKSGADAEIHAAVADLVLTLRTEDYLALPDLVPVTIPVVLPPAARTLYARLEKEMFVSLSAGEVTAVSAATLSNKVLQCASGAMFLDGEAHAWEEVHAAKIDALRDIIDETGGAPLLVAYHYKPDLHRLRKAFPQARVLDESPQTVVDWNAGQIPLLLAHPQSAAFGLNLQVGGHHLCWFTQTWSLDIYDQMNARLHRQGQDRPVFIYHLIATDTVDELVLERLRSKRTVQDVLLDALKVQIGP
jgi:SNF2 family DNA or RNA helicase